MTVGKCMRKGWAWKPVKAHLIPFDLTEMIGTVKCEVTSNQFSEEEIKEASTFTGYSPSKSSLNKLVFEIRGSEDRKLNKVNYSALKSQLENSNLQSAERAVLATKKAIRQITTIRCGSKR